MKKITTFVRRPTWVAPVQGLEQHVYSDEEKKDFVEKPGALLQYRRAQEININSFWPLFLANSEVQSMTYATMSEQMRQKLQNEVLEHKLIPRWAVGCRRLTPGINYLETLGADNVDVVYGEIERITENGCVGEGGKEYPVDVLICATGFDTSFKPRFTLIGENGANLADEWALEPKSYLSLAAAGFPNYFMFIGPNSPIGNGPVLITMGEYCSLHRNCLN